MSIVNDNAVALFLDKAQKAAINTAVVASIEKAFEYAITICEEKNFCRLLLPSNEGIAVDSSKEELPVATVKTIAVPGFLEKHLNTISDLAKQKGIKIITDDLKSHMAGIDMTITIADFGIAETATSVLSTSDEDYQLATMICEIHVVILPKSNLFLTSEETVDMLQNMMEKTGAYTSFISGPSRTADIERVAAIGVHGPLEMHVALLEA